MSVQLVTGNHAADFEHGGGISIFSQNETTPKIIDCVIEENSAPSGNGGGLYVRALGDVWIVNSSLRDNDAQNGGGMFVTGAVTKGEERGLPCDPGESNVLVNMQNCVVSCNHADGDGGGLYVSTNAHADIVNTTIAGNDAL